MHIHNISLSFDDLSAVSSDIKIKQNDGMAHKLNISGLDFSDAERAVIKFLRSDGVTVCDEITYNDNTAEYTLCPAALAASGTVKAEISLYSGDMRITSCNFVFDVIPDINVDFALTDTDTFPVFDSIVKDMKTYVKKENGKGLSSNDYTDAAKEAVDELGYSIDPNTNLPSYNSNSIWSVKKFKAEDSVTGGLQVGTYLMLHTKNGLRDVVYGSTNLQAELDKKVDTVTGKGLSANDYTDTEKEEVAKIKDKVGFTDYATQAGKAGIVSIGTEVTPFGIGSQGVLQLAVVGTNEIDKRNSLHMWDEFPLGLGNLDYAVRSVRPNVVQNTNSEITLTCTANTIYCLGGDENVTSIALTLPATGQYGDFIQVDFYSDSSSPTNLTITSNAGFTDFTLIPEGDHIYSLFFDWGMAFGDSAWGWRFSYAEYPYVSNPYTEV